MVAHAHSCACGRWGPGQEPGEREPVVRCTLGGGGDVAPGDSGGKLSKVAWGGFERESTGMTAQNGAG